MSLLRLRSVNLSSNKRTCVCVCVVWLYWPRPLIRQTKKKLTQLWTGPWKIKQFKSPIVVEIQNIHTHKHQTVHVDRITSCKTQTENTAAHVITQQVNTNNNNSTVPTITSTSSPTIRRSSRKSQPPSHVAVAITLNAVAKASSLKTTQTSSKSAYKRQRNACSNYAPLERTALRTRSVTNKQKTKKHHIFAPTAGARCTIFPKLCMVVELVVPILKGVIHFWI